MTFDPDAYWRSQGEWLAGPGAASPEHKLAEVVLREVLNSLGPIDSVLDVGCGRGRLASLLLDLMPKTKYSGLDIGAAQVAATAKVRPNGKFYESRIQDFEPFRKWDLVLVSEVLMHIPPADIQAVCNKLRTLARKWIVTVDWTEPIPGPIAEENWLHDYPALFNGVQRQEKIGLQSVFVVIP